MEAQYRRVIAAAVILAAAILAVSSVSEAAVNCGRVDLALAPCLNYLRGRGGNYPSKPCCDGVRAVKGMVGSPADRRAACNCVKAAANRYADLKDAAAQSLAGKCGVQLSIPVSRYVDCNKLK
ncbi:non-specific lipid-transfer protein 1-like [Andrographis paniculata]|uniref:non-specific lipid-transfer protein 1-like n=1 Tax=Andrographis paniculata TaxID=175694 RepID=UPI0021E6E1F2|nr:non-specific lipid-transfer protein 1-like [Andrographis paniculata]